MLYYILCYTIYYSILYYTVLFHALPNTWWSNVLFFMILAMLYHTIIYYTMSYYTTPYYTILDFLSLLLLLIQFLFIWRFCDMEKRSYMFIFVSICRINFSLSFFLSTLLCIFQILITVQLQIIWYLQSIQFCFYSNF